MSKCKKIITENYAYLILFFVYAIVNLSMVSVADDLVFQRGFADHGGVFSFISFYYNNWSGRIIPHTLLVFLLNMNPLVIQMLNAVMMLLLVKVMDEICGIGMGFRIDKKQNLILVAGLMFLFFVDPEVLGFTSLWKCAAVLYVWGNVCALVAVLPILFYYRGEKCKLIIKILAIVCGIYASNFEQSAVFMVVFMAFFNILALIKYKKIDIYNLIFWIVVLMCTVLSLKAPGNALRIRGAILSNVNYYDMFSTFDKLMYAVSTMLYLLKMFLCNYLLIICALLWIVISKENLYKKVMLAIPTAYYLLMVLQDLISKIPFIKNELPFELEDWLFNYQIVSSDSFTIKVRQWISVFLGIVCLCILLMYIFLYVRKEIEWLGGLFFGAGLAEVLMIGLTPMVSGSGTRSSFTAYMFMIFTCYRLVLVLWDKRKIN